MLTNARIIRHSLSSLSECKRGGKPSDWELMHILLEEIKESAGGDAAVLEQIIVLKKLVSNLETGEAVERTVTRIDVHLRQLGLYVDIREREDRLWAQDFGLQAC